MRTDLKAPVTEPLKPGNPNAVERMLDEARATLTRAKGVMGV